MLRWLGGILRKDGLDPGRWSLVGKCVHATGAEATLIRVGLPWILV